MESLIVTFGAMHWHVVDLIITTALSLTSSLFPLSLQNQTGVCLWRLLQICMSSSEYKLASKTSTRQSSKTQGEKVNNEPIHFTHFLPLFMNEP